MKKLFYRPILLTLILLCTLLTILQVSYGYFDILSEPKTSIINIGDWLNNIPTDENIREYVEREYPGVELSEYILDTLGTYDATSSYFLADSTFNNYTMGELIETVKLIDEFKNVYLSYSSGNYIYPTNNKPGLQTITTPPNTTLLPGDDLYLRQTFLLANYDSSTQNVPLTFQLTLELPGTDLSDISVEVLFDNSPFSTSQSPFRYSYEISDNNTYITSGKNIQDIDNLISIGNNLISYRTTKTNSNNTTTYYRHTYTKPDVTGNWSRFKSGANLAVTSNGSLSGLTASQGMKVIGKPSGGPVLMEFDINFRNPASGYTSIPIIPVIIVISRGRMVNSNDQDIDTRTNGIMPIVKMRYVYDTIGKN